MIELAFVVCLTAAPAKCETRALQFAEISLMTCVMGAQPQLARWVGEHPGWHIERWICKPIGDEREV